MSLHTVKHFYKVSKKDRHKINDHRSFLIWFTGLSGSGKSTLANLVEVRLHQKGIATFSLDGDNIRQGINKDLTFSKQDRTENIRRIAEISHLMVEAGLVTIAAFVSPYIKDRAVIKSIVGEENFIEIYVNTSLQECERRDVKGLYKKARSGDIKNMTGITDPYEAPKSPDLEINTEKYSIQESVTIIMKTINKKLKCKGYE